ncbi:Protein FAM13A [Geodia barretti]|uniref:Protein FAM13A n=2 Tax=Geodia barretti TaxID=519541 RepID=A0AA35SFN8_GEOBA|nr:Protein FAM13A [Geodia barretti]
METRANKPPSGKAQTDVYGLLLPSKSDSNSPALKNRKPRPQKSRDAHVTADDITTIPNSSTTGVNEATALASVQLRRHESPSDERRGRREGGRRNRQSVVVETDMTESGAEIQVFSRRSESKGGRSGVVVVESGRVSNLVRQFDEVDGPSQPEGQVQNETPHKKKKMANKHFDMFEQTGLVMGLNRGSALPSSTPQQLNREQEWEEEEQIVKQHQPDTLHHLTKTRPKGPANRRLPGSRLSPLSPPHLSSSGSHVSEWRGEGGEREEEEEEKGQKKEDVDGLAVPVIRRHRRSPRRERKRKSPKSLHRRNHHQSAEVAPEDSATNNVAEGWTEETEGEIFRPSRPELLAHVHHDPVAVPIWEPREKKGSYRDGETPREAVFRGKVQLSEMTAGEDRETSRKKDRHSESSKKLSREDEREAKKLKEAEDRETKELDTRTEAKSHADTKKATKLAVAERREARKIGKKETSGEERGITEKGGKEREALEKGGSEGEGGGRESVAGHTPGLEVTLKKLMTGLSRKRASSGRPEDLQEMSQAQLMDEKNSVQRTLLHFEKIHGRPGTVADKELMRPLYERYREVKKLLSAHRSSGTSSSAAAAGLLRQHQESTSDLPSAENTVTAGESTLPSITLLSSGLAQSLPLDSHPRSTSTSDVAHSTSLSSAPSSSLSIPPSSSSLSTSSSPSNDRVTVRKRVAGRKGDVCEERDGEEKWDTHSRLLSELFAQQESALAEKKRLRKILRDFESDFLSEHGRAATRDDRQPRQREYQEYKAIKEKLLKISNEINRATPLQKTL